MIAAEHYEIGQIVLVVNKFDLPDSDILLKVRIIAVRIIAVLCYMFITCSDIFLSP